MNASLPREHEAVKTRERSAAERRSANVRTALILASIALVFFVGVFAARLLGSPVASIGVVGAAVLLFLAVSIGRHLRKPR